MWDCRDRMLRCWRSPGNKVDRLLLICMSPLVALGVLLPLCLCLCNIPQTNGPDFVEPLFLETRR